MPQELFSNYPVTTVSSGGTTAPSSGSAETWTVASSAAFPAAAAGATQFHVADPVLPGEVIAVTNVSGTTWTVTRGAESTATVAHTSGFTVKQVVSAGWLGTVLQLQAATSTAGYTLVNGTGNVLSWTAPNDGKLHRATLAAVKHVTSGETGGAFTFGSQNAGGGGALTPDGAASWVTVYNGGQASGAYGLAGPPELIVGAGKTIYLFQSSALSAGAAVLWAEIWGS